jgi:hypothetical protein
MPDTDLCSSLETLDSIGLYASYSSYRCRQHTEWIEDQTGPPIQHQRERSSNFYLWGSPFAPSSQLDEKRRLRSGDLRWLVSYVRPYQSLDVKLEDGTNRQKSRHIRVSNELPIVILFTRTIRSSHRPHRRLYSRRQSLRCHWRRLATAINILLWHVVAVRWSIQRVTDDADSYSCNRLLKRKITLN